MRTYYLINVLTLMFFITVPVQSQPNKNPSAGKSLVTGQQQAEEDIAKAKTKDSLVKMTNKELDEAIKKLNVVPDKQEQLVVIKENRRKLEKEFLSALTDYVATSRKKEKVIIVAKKKTDLLTQLKEEEIFFIKDSACVKYRKPLFGKKKCTQWGNYTFSLEDKFGNIEKL